MSDRRVSIRLGIDGKADVTRDIGDITRAGETGFSNVAKSIGASNQQADLNRQKLGEIATAAKSAAVASQIFGEALRLAAAFGATLSVEGIISFGKEIFKSTAEIENQAKVLGISTDGLQAFHAAAVLSGAGADVGDAAIRRFTRSIGDAFEGSKKQVEAFGALHISADDLSGGTETSLPKVARALLDIKDASERARIEVALFGKAGQDTEQLLEKWADPAIIESMKNLGFVIDEQIIKQAHSADVAWDVFWLKFKASAVRTAEEIMTGPWANLQTMLSADWTKLSTWTTPVRQQTAERLAKQFPDEFTAVDELGTPSYSGPRSTKGPPRQFADPEAAKKAQDLADRIAKQMRESESAFIRSWKFKTPDLLPGEDPSKSFGTTDAKWRATQQLTDAQTMRDDIKKLWDDYYDHRAQREQALSDEIMGAEEHAFDRFGNFITQGNLGWESFKKAGIGALQDIESELIKLSVLNPLKNALFGGDASGNLLPTIAGGGDLIGSLPSIANGNVGSGILGAGAHLFGYANGGDVAGGVPILVGERGPEVFRPSTSGHIFPNYQVGGDGSGTMRVEINVNVTGARGSAEIQEAVYRGVVAASPHIIGAAVTNSVRAVKLAVRNGGGRL